jgi:hypothetical protein
MAGCSGPKELRWAIAGRSATKLADMKQRIGDPRMDTIVADASAPETLRDMAALTRLDVHVLLRAPVCRMPTAAASVVWVQRYHFHCRTVHPVRGGVRRGCRRRAHGLRRHHGRVHVHRRHDRQVRGRREAGWQHSGAYVRL